MEVPRQGVELELQPLAYTTVTTISDLSYICALHHSLWQCWIQICNPLRESRGWTCILMDTSWILNPLSHNRNSPGSFSLLAQCSSLPLLAVSQRLVSPPRGPPHSLPWGLLHLQASNSTSSLFHALNLSKSSCVLACLPHTAATTIIPQANPRCVLWVGAWGCGCRFVWNP